MLSKNSLMNKNTIDMSKKKTKLKPITNLYPVVTIFPALRSIVIYGLLWFFLVLNFGSMSVYATPPEPSFPSNAPMTSLAQIVGVRTAIFPDKFRVVIDANGSLHAVFYRDQTGKKFQVKFISAKLDTKIDFTPDPNSLIQNISGYNAGKNVILMLQGAEPLAYKSFFISNPERMVVDFTVDKSFVAVVSHSPRPVKLAPKPLRESPMPLKAEVQQLSFAPPEQSKPNIQQHPASVVVQKNSSKHDIVVVIDPGHGGKDPGAIGVHGVYEKDVVLKISRYLQYYLNRQKGFKAILTRNGDYFIPLRQRLNIAHKNRADMFMAIHADAYKYRNSRGASVFALSQRGATSEAARWLAEKENASELGHAISDKDAILKSVLIDLAQTATISTSLEIGNSLLQKLGKITHLHHHQVEQAAFVVLKSPDIPSLLLESGFISDEFEESRLAQSNYQQYLAYTLAEGLVSHFANHRR